MIKVTLERANCLLIPSFSFSYNMISKFGWFVTLCWQMRYCGPFKKMMHAFKISESFIHCMHDFPRVWWRHQIEHLLRYWPSVRGTTGHRWIPLTKASDAELWYCLWSAPEQTVYKREAGDMRRHLPHYDVTVMKNQWHSFLAITSYFVTGFII